MNKSGAKLMLIVLWLIGSGQINARTIFQDLVINDTTKYWNVDPADFEFSMTLIAMIGENGMDLTTEPQEIGAFHKEELRGSAKAFYIDQNQSYVFFLTVFGNQVGDTIQFSLYNHQDESILNIEEELIFLPDTHQGEILNPYPFSVLTTGLNSQIHDPTIKVYPNPTFDFINIEGIDNLKSIYIMNSTGVLVKKSDFISPTNQSPVILDFTNLSNGHYFIFCISDQSPKIIPVSKI